MMLAELEAHYNRILDAMDEIARLVDAQAKNDLKLSAARLVLSKASTDRARYIIEKIYPVLINGADPRLLAQLESLSQDFRVQRLASSRHVTTWTSRAIEEDWAGYQVASQRIRRMMLDRIELEKRVLYPKLRA